MHDGGQLRLCVYCGSSPGRKPEYLDVASKLGALMAAHNIELVYGGANVGLMGALANAILSHGGSAIGVLPKVIEKKEIAHPHLTKLYRVDTMHQRKEKMMSLADAVLALPGGLGTLEELFEALTWSQLQLHVMPCGILDIGDYYTPLLKFMEQGGEQGFVNTRVLAQLLVSHSPEAAIRGLFPHLSI